MDDPKLLTSILSSSSIILQPISAELIVSIVVITLLLICSAAISGAEVAFFSLNPSKIDELKQKKNKINKTIIALLEKPKRLLATILIFNNFVNIGIIILSTFIINQLFNFGDQENLKFIIQVIIVSFLLLLLGEVTPKIYATRKATSFVRFMALPLFYLQKAFNPLSTILINSTAIIDKRIKWKKKAISVEDLSKALEITSEKEKDDENQKILEGIVKFGNTEVKQIMKARIDVISIDFNSTFEDVLEIVKNNGFSRIPVFEDNFDTIKGVLYIKDILPFLEKPKNFGWKKLIRDPFFVPENKKIDNLLKEFQAKRTHLAIVVDEYGGSSGIITLEDVLEEIVGDISDEFDDDEINYTKLKKNEFIFEGKTPLIDFCRILKIDVDVFEEAKGESDTLAGFVIELTGKIPLKMEKITFDPYLFTIEAADKRRVKSIKVTINEN